MRGGFLFVLLSLSLGLSGCAVALVGAGALGGYAVSRDSVVDSIDRSPEEVFQASLQAARELGQVTGESRQNRLIRLRIDNVNVRITVRPMTQRTVQIKIRARNQFLMPRVAVAGEVYAKIKERL